MSTGDIITAIGYIVLAISSVGYLIFRKPVVGAEDRNARPADYDRREAREREDAHGAEGVPEHADGQIPELCKNSSGGCNISNCLTVRKIRGVADNECFRPVPCIIFSDAAQGRYFHTHAVYGHIKFNQKVRLLFPHNFKDFLTRRLPVNRVQYA